MRGIFNIPYPGVERFDVFQVSELSVKVGNKLKHFLQIINKFLSEIFINLTILNNMI